MNKINFKLIRTGYLVPSLFVDNKYVPLKSNGNGNWTAVFETDKSSVDIKISNFYELSAKGGLINAFLLWIVGLFGIFSPKYQKKCPLILYEANNVSLQNENNLICNFQPFKEGERAIDFESMELEKLDNATNKYQYDMVAEKRRKIFTSISWLLRLLAVITGIILIFVL